MLTVTILSGDEWRHWLWMLRLAVHSRLHVVRCMHAGNAAQRVVIACSCGSHQKVTPRQTNLIMKSSAPTITLGICCWMHRGQRRQPYSCSGGGVAIAAAGSSPSNTNRCPGNRRENSTQQGQSFGQCSINRYCIWKTDELCSSLLFMVLYFILPVLAPG